MITEAIPACPKCGSYEHCAVGDSEPCEPKEVVCELMLCEQNRLVLRPDVPYRFRAAPGCDECHRLTEEASSVGEGLRSKNASFSPKSGNASIDRLLAKQKQDSGEKEADVSADRAQGQNELSVCAACEVDVGTCPHCGTYWVREGEKHIGYRRVA